MKVAVIFIIMLIISIVPSAFATYDHDDIKEKMLKN
ncbi:MAG: hypothetical protein KatS3mg003_0866 [Candidatus Nitrosocaldaceae archaeon]|nr:MAG: hypothetical protein KatS3mg003_0866 [Candidatus Nitrosocaldaceae archaeon]